MQIVLRSSRVRMKDIARDLGVSVVTVSKALHNHHDISAATRERVLRRMKELNYQPNWVARSLVTRRTYIIGLVVPDLMHSFFAEIAKGIAQRVREHGYHIVISNSEEDAALEAQEVELLLARQVDGLILASAGAPGGENVFEQIDARRTPCVLIDRLIAGISASYVGVDDQAVGEMATEHLIAQGCRCIAHLRGPDVSPGLGRLQGYEAALTRQGMPAPPEFIVDAGASDATGYEAMRRLLQLSPRPDGVFAFNDPVAAGAIKAVLESGLRVPDDIAVIGVGNVLYSDLLQVPLSTIDQSTLAIGQNAADLLLELIRAKQPLKPTSVLIPPRLIVRASTLRRSR